MIIKIKKINDNAIIPSRAHENDAGFDLFAVEHKTLAPGEFSLIPTGIIIELPKNAEAQVRPRSGLALKYGVTVLNTPGTIDAGYRGEIGVILINHSKAEFIITKGMRIAQLVVKKIYEIDIIECEFLSDSDRSENGFGSSGLK